MRSYKLWALCCVLVSALDFAKSQANETDRCEQNSVTPISCADVDPTNYLLPHPDDCQLFYYCVQPYLPPVCRECPSNLHFNPTLNVCDWPHQAGCQVKNRSQANETERCERNSVTPVYCADGDANTTDSLLPHPDDCQLFYYCEQPYLPPVCRECPSNLHFNPILKVCDWPNEAGCQLGNNSGEFTTTEDSTTEYISVNDTNTERNTTLDETTPANNGTESATPCERIYEIIYKDLPDYVKALDYAFLKSLLYNWLGEQPDLSAVVDYMDKNC